MGDKIRILFLSANPSRTSKLKVVEECNEIEDKLQASRDRDKFDLIQRHAMSVEDLQRTLLHYEPQLVHFSGHGNKKGSLLFQTRSGKIMEVQPQALANLFKILKDMRCVLLNACYSEKQVRAIAPYVGGVIGMSKSITDEAARAFSVSFYQGLGNGKNLKEAFQLGLNQLELQNISKELIPTLILRPDRPRFKGTSPIQLEDLKFKGDKFGVAIVPFEVMSLYGSAREPPEIMDDLLKGIDYFIKRIDENELIREKFLFKILPPNMRIRNIDDARNICNSLNATLLVWGIIVEEGRDRMRLDANLLGSGKQVFKGLDPNGGFVYEIKPCLDLSIRFVVNTDILNVIPTTIIAYSLAGAAYRIEKPATTFDDYYRARHFLEIAIRLVDLESSLDQESSVDNRLLPTLQNQLNGLNKKWGWWPHTTTNITYEKLYRQFRHNLERG